MDTVGDATQVLWIYVPTFAAEGDQRFVGAALWRGAPDTSQLGWAATMAQAIAKALFAPLPTMPTGPMLGPIPGTNIPLGAQSQTVAQQTQYVWLLDFNGNAVQGFAYGTGTPWKQMPIMLAGEPEPELELGAAAKVWAVHDVWETPESGIWRLVSRSQPIWQTERDAHGWEGTWHVQNFGKPMAGFRSPTAWVWKSGRWQRAQV